MRQGQETHSENTWREQATPKTATPLHLVKSPANEAAGLVASLARLNALLARINGEKHRQLERLAVLTLQNKQQQSSAPAPEQLGFTDI